MADTGELERQAEAHVLHLIFMTVVDSLARDLDVTDDVAGRDLHQTLHKHLTGNYFRELAAGCTPAQTMKWAAGYAAKIRLSASMAVAAALDEARGASEPSLARFVHLSILEEVGAKHRDDALPDFCTHVARVYSAMCRRSGLPPEKWLRAFHEAVQQDRWAFRRD